MFSHQAQLSQNDVQLTQEQKAVFARQLIVANEHYRLSNSDEVELEVRQQHRLQARILVEDVAGEDPGNASALNLLGRIALDDGNTRDAANYMLAAIELAPETAHYYVNLGYVRLAARDYELAEKLFNRALELQMNDAQAFAGLAYVHLHQGEHLSAFLRLRSLLQKGYAAPYARHALFEAARTLWADRYEADLDQDLQSYFSWSDLDAFQLGNLTASLLVHKYGLSQEDALPDLDVLAQDQLLLAALHRSLLPSRLVEKLLTNVRKAILMEAFETRYLRDSLQAVVCALAVYASRTGYVFSVSRIEQTMLDRLHEELRETLAHRDWQQQDVVAALMLKALYEPLYGQPYAFQLLEYNLDAWPEALRAVLSAALYEPAKDHMVEFDLCGDRTSQTLAATPLVRGASPKWESLGAHPQTNYLQALEKELGGNYLPTPAVDQNLRIMVAGCRSGQRALRLARFFEGVEVAAVDPNLDNIVQTIRAAERYEINTMSYACLSLRELGQIDASFDVIECGTGLGPVKKIAETMRLLAGLLQPDGLIRFTLPRRAGRQEIDQVRARLKARDLVPTPDNVRTVREVLLEEAAQGMWQEIVGQPEFYTLPGTRDLLFAEDEPSFNLRDVHGLLQAAGLAFIGFVDLDPVSRQRVRALNPRDLMAWHNLDESHQTVFTDSYEIYCRKA